MIKTSDRFHCSWCGVQVLKKDVPRSAKRCPECLKGKTPPDGFTHCRYCGIKAFGEKGAGGNYTCPSCKIKRDEEAAKHRQPAPGEAKCNACRHNFPEEQINRGLCPECTKTTCPTCLEKFTEEELGILEKLTGICEKCLGNRAFSMFERNIAPFNKKIEELEKEIQKQREEISKETRKKNWRILHSRCKKCGKLNDSRDEKGLITKSYCTKCRQLYGDIKHMEQYRPHGERDTRVIPIV